MIRTIHCTTEPLPVTWADTGPCSLPALQPSMIWIRVWELSWKIEKSQMRQKVNNTIWTAVHVWINHQASWYQICFPLVCKDMYGQNYNIIQALVLKCNLPDTNISDLWLSEYVYYCQHSTTKNFYSTIKFSLTRWPHNIEMFSALLAFFVRELTITMECLIFFWLAWMRCWKIVSLLVCWDI